MYERFGELKPMLNEIIETRGHTTPDGTLNLTVNVGVADIEVVITVHVKVLTHSAEVDSNEWPIDFFEQIAGSMPDLQPIPQGEFEERSFE